MSFRWQDGHMRKFLDSYRRRECLWNTQHKDYTKTNSRDIAYASMVCDISIPGLTVGDIKAKIKTVRTRYGAELNKIKASEKNGDEVYEPRLFWFKEADAFLRNCNARARRDSIDTTQSHYLHGSEDNPNEYYELNNMPVIVKTEPLGSFENSSNLENTENPSTETPVAVSKIESIPKAEQDTMFRNARKRSNTSSDALQTAIKHFRQMNEPKPELHEFDVFCNSLAIQLKKMPLDRAIICAEKLQSVITQERLYQLQTAQSQNSLSDSNCTHVKEEHDDVISDSASENCLDIDRQVYLI